VHFLPTNEITYPLIDGVYVYVQDCPTCYQAKLDEKHLRVERIKARKTAKRLKRECRKAEYLKDVKRWQGVEDGTDNLV
jgi:type II secretory pathway component PulJ